MVLDVCILNNQLNPCNCTNQYICCFSNSIFAVYSVMTDVYFYREDCMHGGMYITILDMNIKVYIIISNTVNSYTK